MEVDNEDVGLGMVIDSRLLRAYPYMMVVKGACEASGSLYLISVERIRVLYR